MNELDPDTRDLLLELLEESGGMIDELARIFLLVHHYGHQGFDVDDTIKAVMEAVG